MAVSFIGGGNRSTRRKPDLSHVTYKLYHIMLYQVCLVWVRFELTMLLVIGTNYISSYKSNYHTITITNTTALVHYMMHISIWKQDEIHFFLLLAIVQSVRKTFWQTSSNSISEEFFYIWLSKFNAIFTRFRHRASGFGADYY